MCLNHIWFIFKERHRIDVDCRRTDRNQPLFSTPAEIHSTDLDDEKDVQRHYSIISPNMNDIGAQSPTNEHIDRMAGILLTYNFYEKELGMSYSSVSIILNLISLWSNLGYVQGMSDLCAPIYVVMGGNEEMTFWCFVEVMNRMVNGILFEETRVLKITFRNRISCEIRVACRNNWQPCNN